MRLFDTVFPRLTSNAWEDLCRQAVPHLSERLGGIDFGPASRYWAGAGPEWDVVSEALDGSALLLGEVKWIDGEPSATAVEHAARELFLKGALPLRRLDGATVHHVIFVSRKPRGKLRLAMPNVHVLDANDVLGVLR